MSTPSCDAHKTPIKLAYKGSFFLNNGSNTFGVSACSGYRAHMVNFATNSTGWEGRPKDGKINVKHSEKNGNPAWFKIDTEFAVAVATTVSVNAGRNVKRAGAQDYEEAFDLKVSTCAT